MLLASWHRLGEAAREVLQLLAVGGRPVDVEVLERLVAARGSDDVVRPSIAEAAGEGLVVREAGRVWFWTDESGVPAHLSAMNAPAFGAARIGPVYTPKEHRGQGYAGNTVAALSQRILDSGAVPCLFTDQANPASNALYAALGYRPIVDMVNLLIR